MNLRYETLIGLAKYRKAFFELFEGSEEKLKKAWKIHLKQIFEVATNDGKFEEFHSRAAEIIEDNRGCVELVYAVDAVSGLSKATKEVDNSNASKKSLQ